MLRNRLNGKCRFEIVPGAYHESSTRSMRFLIWVNGEYRILKRENEQ